MRVFLIFAALILASCTEPMVEAEAPKSNPPKATAEPKPDTPEACTKNGGTWRPVCLMGTPACVMPYSDAGKPCTDKKECQGQCRYEGNGETPPPGTKVTGACQRTTDPCGCFGVVADGKLEAMLCVD